MKYCISNRQQRHILQKADQIKVRFEDRERLINYVEDYQDKTIILEIKKGNIDLDWDLYKVYAEKVDFILCIEDLNLAVKCFAHGIKFYWKYPIFTWYELNAVIALRPCYILLSAPLSFSLDKVKAKTDIPIRLCPNLAYDAYIPRVDGICGSWIRPEDTNAYEKWVDTFEFVTDDLTKEAQLLHIYKENGQWPGNINLLITNLNKNIDNRAILDGFGEKRATCGQRCMENGSCHYCEGALKLASAIRDAYYDGIKEANSTESSD